MKFDFTNRNILILGSSSGIGFEAAKQLAIDHGNVCLVGRDLQKLQKAYKNVNQINPNGKNIYICADLTKQDSAEYIWQESGSSVVIDGGVTKKYF